MVVWNGRELDPEALAGAAALVHLAGEPIFGGRLPETRRRKIRSSRVDSTDALVAALAALPAARRPGCFVCASAVGYYGSRGDAVLDESAEPGEGFLAEVCWDWERSARAAEALGIRVACAALRGRAGARGRRAADAGPALPVRPRRQARQRPAVVSWIHAGDLVPLIRTVLDDARYRGPLNAVAPQSGRGTPS